MRDYYCTIVREVHETFSVRAESHEDATNKFMVAPKIGLDAFVRDEADLLDHEVTVRAVRWDVAADE